MGYASFLILRDGVGSQRNLALGLYSSQLILNWMFSPIFFNYHKLGLVIIYRIELIFLKKLYYLNQKGNR